MCVIKRLAVLPGVAVLPCAVKDALTLSTVELKNHRSAIAVSLW